MMFLFSFHINQFLDEVIKKKKKRLVILTMKSVSCGDATAKAVGMNTFVPGYSRRLFQIYAGMIIHIF